MNVTSILAGFLRRMRGETPTRTICRKQRKIDTVVTREQADISALVEGQLASIRSFAANGLRNIDDLAATGALSGDQRRAVEKVRTLFGSAQAAI